VNKIIQALLLLTLSYSLSADYEPWWGESEWVLGHGYLAGKQIAPYPCLIIPSQAIKTQQKKLTFRFTYLKNEENIDKDDIKFIEHARRIIETTKNNKPKSKSKSYYALVLTITIEKEKRLYEPLLQLTRQAQEWLKAGNMLQFYRQCGTHYIQSAIVESSMRLWISYHPRIMEQAKKLQELLSKNFPDNSNQDVTRISWFKKLEKLNIGTIPSRLYMEGFGNSPINVSNQPVNQTLIADWINQALQHIYQPEGGIIKKIQKLPWLSNYPAVATYCIHHPLKCDLKRFYLKKEALEAKKQRNRRYSFLAIMQKHKNT